MEKYDEIQLTKKNGPERSKNDKSTTLPRRSEVESEPYVHKGAPFHK